MKKSLALLLLTVSLNSYANVQWECIDRENPTTLCYTWRMSVPTGWVIATEDRQIYKGGFATVFVPDQNHEWKL